MELKTLEEGCSYRLNPIWIQCLREEINTLKEKEECMWKQRSQNAWLKEGDSNTRYFHCRANQRNRHNLVLGIEDEAGTWEEDEAATSGMVERYFETMFTTSNPSGFEDIINGVRLATLDDEEVNLGRDFQAFEVYQALKQMAPFTAPRPNGMSPIFYKSFWHIIGEDVTKVVLQALNSGTVPAINSTFVALMPKIKYPKKVSNFRPISLCIVIYKLISKVVVNQLKKFLARLIPDSQSAFLSGCLIIYNILVAFETLHYLKRKTKGKLGYMDLKLDMSKAYDCVKMEFLEKIMIHLVMERRMVKIIMSCLKFVSYSVLLNGQLVVNIKPSRGLYQGDPLSPYLFLLYALGMQSLLQQAEVDGSIKVVSISRNGPRVSHLLFADDSVFVLPSNGIRMSKNFRYFGCL